MSFCAKISTKICRKPLAFTVLKFLFSSTGCLVNLIKLSEFFLSFRETAEDLLFVKKKASGFCEVELAGDTMSVGRITIRCLLVFPTT